MYAAAAARASPTACFSFDAGTLLAANEEFRLFADLLCLPLSGCSWRTLLGGINCEFLHRDTEYCVRGSVACLEDAMAALSTRSLRVLVPGASIVTALGRLKARSTV